jgi:hypothetical protein
MRPSNGFHGRLLHCLAPNPPVKNVRLGSRFDSESGRESILFLGRSDSPLTPIKNTSTFSSDLKVLTCRILTSYATETLFPNRESKPNMKKVSASPDSTAHHLA